MIDDAQLDELGIAIGDLEEPTALSITENILSGSPSSEDLDKTIVALQRGMETVGERFQSGEYFLAEMLYAADVVNLIMPKIISMLEDSEDRKVLGTILIGTVKGDVHDIGKNLMSVLLRAAAFEVVDLGIDVPAANFITAINEHSPTIVGLSGLLTLSIDPMKETIDAIREAGLRDQVKIVIGGNPVTENIHNIVGSDNWTNNAAEGVSICQGWVQA